MLRNALLYLQDYEQIVAEWSNADEHLNIHL